jgi:hypothetical protein
MAYIDLTQIALVVLALFILKKVFLNQNENPVPLPPRPKRLLILGNITDLPPLVDSPSTGEGAKGGIKRALSLSRD